MKFVTGLLVGVAMLMSSFAGAQYYSQASVTGTVLSYGPDGFMLQGPDGNYGIYVSASTIVSDPWNTFVVTGPGNVAPGDYVTAWGFPNGQWTMQATRVIERNVNPPVYGGYYGGNYFGQAPGTIIRTPNTASPIQPGRTNFNTLPSPTNSTFSPMPVPTNNMINPFAVRAVRG